jgi:hypothetical protein
MVEAQSIFLVKVTHNFLFASVFLKTVIHLFTKNIAEKIADNIYAY